MRHDFGRHLLALKLVREAGVPEALKSTNTEQPCVVSRQDAAIKREREMAANKYEREVAATQLPSELKGSARQR